MAYVVSSENALGQNTSPAKPVSVVWENIILSQGGSVTNWEPTMKSSTAFAFTSPLMRKHVGVRGRSEGREHQLQAPD